MDQSRLIRLTDQLNAALEERLRLRAYLDSPEGRSETADVSHRMQAYVQQLEKQIQSLEREIIMITRGRKGGASR